MTISESKLTALNKQNDELLSAALRQLDIGIAQVEGFLKECETVLDAIGAKHRRTAGNILTYMTYILSLIVRVFAISFLGIGPAFVNILTYDEHVQRLNPDAIDLSSITSQEILANIEEFEGILDYFKRVRRTVMRSIRALEKKPAKGLHFFHKLSLTLKMHPDATAEFALLYEALMACGVRPDYLLNEATMAHRCLDVDVRAFYQEHLAPFAEDPEIAGALSQLHLSA